jgi:transcriptional regulator GlxA family with amidase domain
VPNELIAECTRGMKKQSRSGPALPWTHGLLREPTVERLGRALLAADQVGDFQPLYADSLGVAIVARLLSQTGAHGALEARAPTGLPKWRLKRVVDYIEARLGEPMTLADMASATGLTRMHFAAQFRASTGLRPHEYLLRRRIERAQEMLLTADLSVADIALSVGFQTQSRFTTTFARFVSQTPHAWRLEHRVST